MKPLIAWFAKNHVAANLLMAILVVGGLLTLPEIQQEMLPNLELDMVTVTVPYPGASPTEVEEAICVRVEEELQGITGIKRLRSSATEGAGSVNIQLVAGEDVARRLADIRAAIDGIDDFPEEAERPIVRQASVGRGVLGIAISGDVDELTLKRLGERVRDELSARTDVTQVSLSAVRPYEISIEVSEDALRRHEITFDEVVHAVRRSSIDLPGGSVKARSGEILLRALGQATEGRAFEDIALVSRADGTRLRLGDVANVVDGFAETDQRSTFDGQPAVIVGVLQVGDEKLLDVAAAAEAYVADAASWLPDGIHMTVWQNAADYLDDRLGTMTRNARGGLILVVLVLALFLRLRLALWVSLGIPIAFLGAFAVLPMLGMSINWISLLGFIVVLGIVVDDAIVIGENTYTEQRRSGKKLEGAIKGAQGVAIPVFFGVATTVAAFAPMLFIPGSMGKLTAVLPTVVIACLVFSVVEAMFVLPSHLASGTRGLDDPPSNDLSRRWRTLQDWIAEKLDWMVECGYRPALAWALEWRYLALAGAVAVLMFTAGLLGGGWLRFTFQEPVAGDVITASLTMAPGTPIEVTQEAIARVERAAEAIRIDADTLRATGEPSVFAHMLTSVGEHPSRAQKEIIPKGSAGGARGGANLAEVQVEMAEPEQRRVGTDEMQRRWREEVGDIPGATEITFHNSMVPTGAPIELELLGQDLEELSGAADLLKSRLSGYPGVFDIRDSFQGGKQELRFEILPSAEALGLSLADVARQVRQAFYGDEAQRIQRGRDDVKVMVRYPPERRRSLSDVERMYIRTADGSEVPFASVARASLGRGYAAIARTDRKRVVTVTADVDVAMANANEIIADLEAAVLPDLQAIYPRVHHSFEGEQAEQREFMSAMMKGSLIAMLVIYGLLAVPLGSYGQPLIIMTAIPFGLVGAAWGHILLGYDFSMYSVIGLVALSGVVVNASLVLVDYVNQLRAAGTPLLQAVSEAGRARLRAILLTSLTTFIGLSPMMLETSISARFMIPMAIALAFGVLFASVITLFIVPCCYVILEDLTHAKWRSVARVPSAAEALDSELGETTA